MRLRALLSTILLLSACAADRPGCAERPTYADRVIHPVSSHPGAFSDPARAANGVRGAGTRGGSHDVFSLDRSPDGALVLAWSAGAICDGPGPDLAVFENPFRDDDDPTSTFFEPVVVSVSADGKSFLDFPHEYLGPDADDISVWRGFAGMTPVLLHEETNRVSPFDAGAAGGDRFDLAAIGLTEVRFVRLTAAQRATDARTGSPYPGSHNAFADIDGAYARYFSGGNR